MTGLHSPLVIPDDHECWRCEHWGGDTPAGSAVCVRRRAPMVRSSPESGCAFWVRATGSDDTYLPTRTE